MPASQEHVTVATPMGATLVGGGATFRVWAPGAESTSRSGGRRVSALAGGALVKEPGAGTGPALCRAWSTARSTGTSWSARAARGSKRDPWARELELLGYPDCDCIVRSADSYPWHDAGFRPPAFDELVVYQFHVGVLLRPRRRRGRDRRPGRVAEVPRRPRPGRIPGRPRRHRRPAAAVRRVPGRQWSLGYNGTDLFSPEMDYCVAPGRTGAVPASGSTRCSPRRGRAPLRAQQLAGQVNQLKAFVDLCHLYGLAVLPTSSTTTPAAASTTQSLDFFDLPAVTRTAATASTSPATTGPAAGSSPYAEPEVASFLIGNAPHLPRRIPRRRVPLRRGHRDRPNGGWSFCQDLTGTLRYRQAVRGPDRRVLGASRAGGRCAPPPDARAWASTSATPTACATACARCSGPGGRRRRRRRVDIGRLRDRAVPAVERRRPPGRPTTASRTTTWSWTPTATTAQPRIPRWPTATTPGRGTPAAAAGSRPACCSPRPACRCSSWARSSWRTSSGPTTRQPDRLLIWWDGLDGADRHAGRLPPLHPRPAPAAPPAPGAAGRAGHRVPRRQRQPGARLPPLGSRRRSRRGGRRRACANGPLRPATSSASPAPVAGGTRCSTATSTTTSRTRGCRATPVASTPTGRRGTGCQSAHITMPANGLLVFARDLGD